ncbi:MAG TPA: SPFH domain-containing protein [Anaerolineae bacterium]|nr:SPFH domain-containing protein [Anaerolineae bacterium]
MNIQKLVTFSAKSGIVFLLLTGLLFSLSLAAVTLWFLNYNAPIIPVCPLSSNFNTLSAADPDGLVVKAVISAGWSPHIRLTEITAAGAKNEALTAQLSIFDTIPEGKYPLEIAFVNNDKPVPQTAVCKINVTVLKGYGADGVLQTFYNVKGRSRTVTPRDGVNDLLLRVPLGMIPGYAMLALTMVCGARFVQAFYGLKGRGLGFQFLIYRLIGRPHPKKPKLAVVKGVIDDNSPEQVRKLGGPGTVGMRVDDVSAVVLERAGKLTRVVRSPNTVQLAPFEKVWDALDMRPQRWVQKVGAITRDGLPITYEADVHFRIKDDDDAVFKAATSKWIRDASTTEPERLMIWTKRLVVGAMEGALRGILAQHELDQLLEVDCRRRICQELSEKVSGAANNLGIEILDLSLRDIEFKGQALEQWEMQWHARRDREIARIKAEGTAKRIAAYGEIRMELRREMLQQTIQNLRELTQEGTGGTETDYENYILLSFIQMLLKSAKDGSLYLSEHMIHSLESLRRSLRQERAAEKAEKQPA